MVGTHTHTPSADHRILVRGHRLHDRRRHDRRLRFGDRHGQGRAIAPFYDQDPFRPFRAGAGAGDALRGRRGNRPRRPDHSHRAGSESAACSAPPNRVSGTDGDASLQPSSTILTARSPTPPRTWSPRSTGFWGKRGLAPLPVEGAGSLLGAGARALIKRGFAASGKSLAPETVESAVRRLS